MIGMCLADACCSTGSQPSEFRGAMTRALAPWAMSCCTSLICLLNCDWPLVTRSPVIPCCFASALIDCVSAMRKGLASFSDWEKPTTEVLGSSFVPPNLPIVQDGALPDGVCTTCWGCWPDCAPAD